MPPQMNECSKTDKPITWFAASNGFILNATKHLQQFCAHVVRMFSPWGVEMSGIYLGKKLSGGECLLKVGILARDYSICR